MDQIANPRKMKIPIDQGGGVGYLTSVQISKMGVVHLHPTRNI
jgi:hypothetical protein